MENINRPPTLYILCQSRRECYTYLATNSRTSDTGETLEPVWIGNTIALRGREIFDCDRIVRLKSHYSSPNVLEIEAMINAIDRRTSSPKQELWKVIVIDKKIEVLTWDVQASSEFPVDIDDVQPGIPVEAKFFITLIDKDEKPTVYMSTNVVYNNGILHLYTAWEIKQQ